MTGDHPRTAAAIAREIGLVKSDSPTIITGEQLRRFSVIQLQLALDTQEVIFARVVAAQKMLIVEALRQKKQIVAVTGDGVNDAPALKAAHIGIAMLVRVIDPKAGPIWLISSETLAQVPSWSSSMVQGAMARSWIERGM